MGKRANTINKAPPAVKPVKAKPKAKKRTGPVKDDTLPDAKPEEVEANKAQWKAMLAKLPSDPKPEHAPEELQLAEAWNMFRQVYYYSVHYVMFFSHVFSVFIFIVHIRSQLRDISLIH